MELRIDRTGPAFKDRLGAAIHRWGGSRAVAAFCRAMEERGVRGSTQTAVHQLLRGKQPSLEFVTQAGEVLGVKPAWLAWGEGPVTPAEARITAEIVEQALAGRDAVEALLQVRAEVADELILNEWGTDGEA